jgi:hypothetical protein
MFTAMLSYFLASNTLQTAAAAVVITVMLRTAAALIDQAPQIQGLV